MTAEERFERIEGILERIADDHRELTDGQLNLQKLHEQTETSLKTLADSMLEHEGKINMLIDIIVRREQS